MNATETTRSLGERAAELYARLRDNVETSDNIGKLIVVDVDSGDYEIGDDKGIEASRNLQARHPEALLYALRIGYKSAVSFRGALERATVSGQGP